MNCSQGAACAYCYLLLEVEGEMLMSVMRCVTRLEFLSYDEEINLHIQYYVCMHVCII